jgi:RimJ/RimL family protein N-acetyltransferase
MLEGSKVLLRAIDRDAVEPNYRWINDREVTRFLAIGYPVSRAYEAQFLERASGQNSFSGVHLAIETKDGVYIGNVGLHDANVEHRTATLGIVIGEKDYWANGYGRDAIITLLRFGFEEMNLNRVSLHVFDFNERAIACYKKCGFEIEGRLRENYYGEGSYHDVIVMGVLRDEFDALHGVAS